MEDSNFLNIRVERRKVPYKPIEGYFKKTSSSKVERHLMLTAKVSTPINNTDDADKWMLELIEVIGMKLAKGPLSWYCSAEGNRGLSSAAIITTSTITAHFWNENNTLILDVFSCKNFDVTEVIGKVSELGLQSIDCLIFLDRSNNSQIKLHYVYQTTNLINGKSYIGVHSDYNMKYNYLGSGTLLQKAIEKYGIDNFESKILKVFADVDDAYEYEKLLVNKDYVKREDTYNVQVGGRRPKPNKTDYERMAENNSKKRWVTNGIKESFTHDFERYLEKGWSFGRTFTDQALENMKSSAKNRKPRSFEELSESAKKGAQTRKDKGTVSAAKGIKYSNEYKEKRYRKYIYSFIDSEGKIYETSNYADLAKTLEVSEWLFHELIYNTELGRERTGWKYLGRRKKNLDVNSIE